MATTTFVYRIESDPKLLRAVAALYVESLADSTCCRTASEWRGQLLVLIQKLGRGEVIETLMERVDGLSMRHAVILIDQAEKTPSEAAPILPR